MMGAILLFLMVAGTISYLRAINYSGRKMAELPLEDYPRGIWLAEKVAAALLAKSKNSYLAALKDLRLVGSDNELTLKTASQRLTPNLLVVLLARYCWWCWPGLSGIELTEETAAAARQLAAEYKNKEALNGILDALCEYCRFGEPIKIAVRRLEYLTPAERARQEIEGRIFEEAISR